MSEISEIFKALKINKQEKKLDNHTKSINILKEKNIPYKMLSSTHIRIEDSFDFWPTTGLFINIKTKKRGRGIFKLLKEIKAS